ncbi:alanine--tRNA ligase [Pyruvatibacter mobilis]|uniref:alanine--tRNA ligase n=1 Tax=Pyruvatibacter mobilis TaxID=1712261 RepID=UPI003BAC238C
MASVNEIRQTFLDFFAGKGHEPVVSAPLVPRNDPTLLFNNAGMVPFKNVFTGAEKRDYVRAVSSQKCVRAGGKHNDLDNVGYTARHHTFFEMLGNFSFGDYFKEDAIAFAWELLTKDYDLPADRLTVTVYHEDEEAPDLWKKVAGLGDDRIIRIKTSDNFWSMGDTGPCGPCSEIFFDHGDKVPGGPPGSPDEDGDRFIEIWNLVFMQFDQQADGSRLALPKPSIDTGMGLERIAAVLQGKHDNYDIDLMRALIEASAEASGVSPDGEHAVSHRVIADHLRATSFLIADGVLPSNEGRGYVLRRIMRRAMRHAHIIGARDPLMHRLVPALVAQMGTAYPELQRAQALVTETLKLEEERFRVTLDRGLKLLDEEVAQLSGATTFPGEAAFKLYDTYGFPLDLTQDALRPRGIEVDTQAFDAAMARQKAEARAAWSGSGEAATDAIWLELRDAHGATEFLGYDTEVAEGQIVALVKDGAVVDSLKAGDEGAVIVNQTPFYGESGGQMGDTGVMIGAQGTSFAVTDTAKRAGDLHVHLGKVQDGTLSTGGIVELRVDGERRARLRANHSATHLLHEALRRVLGDHVTQKGSLVAEDRLRFDISHPRAVTADEIAQVEAIVNGVVRDNGDVTTRLMTPDEAIEAGALALFGEKYGDEVRVLSMGHSGDQDRAGFFSTELCGGTHVRRLGDIALVKIVSEGAVSSGVRRIEALTGETARQYLIAQEARAQEAADVLKTKIDDLPARVAQLVDERKKLERELADARKQAALASAGGGGGAPAAAVQEIAGIKVMARRLDGVPAKELRGLVDEGKSEIGSGVVAIVAVADGKAAVAVGVTSDLTDRLSAVDLVRAGSAALGGKGGGGRPDMAQAGGPDPDKADDALAAITSLVAEPASAA